LTAWDPFPRGEWLPRGKTCALLFSIDDLHPARAADGFDAGGGLGSGVLSGLSWLLERHEQLRATLAVTPDWRPKSPLPRPELAVLPDADNLFLVDSWSDGRMRLDRHPEFVAFLKSLPRVEIVPHGLRHMQRGPRVPVEFERADYASCLSALQRAADIMQRAGFPAPRGQVPPGWAAPAPLRQAMRDLGLRFVASARDVLTPVARDAVTAMSGLCGQPLIVPGLTEEGLVHIPTNFQATSGPDRAFAILEQGGLLSIKAHIVKSIGSYVALDALEGAYLRDLDTLLSRIEDRFGDALWWTTMEGLAEATAPSAASPACA
jgi:hypothetical protein